MVFQLQRRSRISTDSLAFQLWERCDRLQANAWFHLDYRHRSHPKDLCTLVRMYLAGLRTLFFLALPWVILVAFVSGLVFVAYFFGVMSTRAYHDVHVNAHTMGFLHALGSEIANTGMWIGLLFGVLIAVLAAGSALIALIAVLVMSIRWCARRASEVHSFHAMYREVMQVFALFGQWLYGAAHGICFPIEVIESAAA